MNSMDYDELGLKELHKLNLIRKKNEKCNPVCSTVQANSRAQCAHENCAILPSYPPCVQAYIQYTRRRDHYLYVKTVFFWAGITSHLFIIHMLCMLGDMS